MTPFPLLANPRSVKSVPLRSPSSAKRENLGMPTYCRLSNQPGTVRT